MPGLPPIFRKAAGWADRNLSRVTSRGEFIPELDGIRFLAIVGVLLFHLGVDLAANLKTPDPAWFSAHGVLSSLAGTGWFGVELFFVLSGLVVALPFARQSARNEPAPDLRRYYLRRLTRIEPPYVIALTVMYLSLTHLSPPYLRQFLPHFLAGLLYSHQYVYGTMNPIDAVTWSLEVEIVFYIVAPLLALIYRIEGNRRRWLLELFLFVPLSYAAGVRLGIFNWTRISILQLIPYFFGGMCLADWYASGLIKRSANLAWDLVVAASAAALILLVRGANGQLWRWFWLAPVLIVVLFAGILQGRLANWFLRLRPVTIVGGMCYTIYLWHPFLIMSIPYRIKQWMIRLPMTQSLAIYWLVGVPAIVVASVPIYLAVERPFMNGPGSRLIESWFHSVRRLVGGGSPAPALTAENPAAN